MTHSLLLWHKNSNLWRGKILITPSIASHPSLILASIDPIFLPLPYFLRMSMPPFPRDFHTWFSLCLEDSVITFSMKESYSLFTSQFKHPLIVFPLPALCFYWSKFPDHLKGLPLCIVTDFIARHNRHVYIYTNFLLTRVGSIFNFNNFLYHLHISAALHTE